MTAAGKSFSRIDSYRFARELMAESPEYSFADAMEQGHLLHKATTGNMLTASEFDRLSMTNQTVQQMFTERTNIPFSVYDNADASVLRRKYSSGIIKVANNTDDNLVFEIGSNSDLYSGRQVIMEKIQSFLINMRVAGTTA